MGPQVKIMPRVPRQAARGNRSTPGEPGLLNLLSEPVRSHSQVRRFSAGDVVVREGEAGTQAFILLSGRCEVTVHGDVLNHVEPGELFGEVACLASGTRTATVRAIQESELLELSTRTLRSELRRSPALLDRFLRDIAGRVRAISHRETIAKDEHRSLRRVLESLRPSLERFENHPSLAVDVRCQPLSFASGDYYDVLEVSPDRFLFALGDVMGHGAPTAPILAAIRGLLHESTTPDSRPHELLGQLHRHLRRHGHPNVFMTLTLLMLDVHSLTGELAVAGPPCPLLYRQGRCSPSTNEYGWTLGYPFDGVSFAGKHITLSHGDVLLFYTDGLSEIARGGDPDGETLGADGLAGILCDVVAADATGIADRVFREVEARRAGSLFEDDATALAVCVR